MKEHVDSYFATHFAAWHEAKGYRVERETLGDIVTWRVYRGDEKMGAIVLAASGNLFGLVANAGPTPAIPREEDLAIYEPEVRPRAEFMARVARGLGAYLDASLPEEAPAEGEEALREQLTLTQTPAAAADKEQRGPSEETLLACIPDERDRLMARLWRQGRTSGQIAKELDYGEGHVRNRITELRKQYGAGVVPRRRS